MKVPSPGTEMGNFCGVTARPRFFQRCVLVTHTTDTLRNILLLFVMSNLKSCPQESNEIAYVIPILPTILLHGKGAKLIKMV